MLDVFKHIGLIKNIINKQKLSTEDSEDLFQDCLLSLVDKSSEFTGTNFLYSKIKSRAKCLRKLANSTAEINNELVAESNFDYILTEPIKEALKKLNEKQQLVLLMNLQGFDGPETGRVIHCSRTRVSQILFDAINTLRQNLKKLQDERRNITNSLQLRFLQKKISITPTVCKPVSKGPIIKNKSAYQLKAGDKTEKYTVISIDRRNNKILAKIKYHKAKYHNYSSKPYFYFNKIFSHKTMIKVIIPRIE